uniref:Uncharacterized protein n=2 Tax=Anguilla anguilla TaxID=7936 RepID=A0A0E9SJJ9_ANGAN
MSLCESEFSGDFQFIYLFFLLVLRLLTMNSSLTLKHWQ